MDSERVRQLAEEIKSQGYWEGALRARRVDGYQLVFGHRRLEALKLLGYQQVNLEIVDLDDSQMALQGLVENFQREGLSDIEKANGIKRLLTLNAAAITQAKVADLLGFSQGSISEFLRPAELDPEIQETAKEAGLSRTTIRTADKIARPEFVRVAAKACHSGIDSYLSGPEA
jgi:ParB/RepB/Spo0J family partition protein